jgi:acetyl-CoA synthetase
MAALVITDSWPGQMRSVWGDHERFFQTYFSTFKGYYFTGDGCRAMTRPVTTDHRPVDDVINVSGHRFGTAEFERAGSTTPTRGRKPPWWAMPHDIKGQGIYAYVSPPTPMSIPMTMRCASETGSVGPA